MCRCWQKWGWGVIGKGHIKMTEKPIETNNDILGSFVLQLPAPNIDFQPTTDFQGYLTSGLAFLRSCETLFKSEEKNHESHTFSSNLLAGFSLECLLKAYLCNINPNEYTKEKLSKKSYGHNIEKLWNEALANGLPSNAQFPKTEDESIETNTFWLFQTNLLHKGFEMRYPTGIYSITSPNMNDVIKHLAWLAKQI